MKKILALLLTSSSLIVNAAICDDPLRDKDLCNGMKHVRSEIHAIGAQRDLMQINYNYLIEVAKELKSTTEAMATKFQDDPSHSIGMTEIKNLSHEMMSLAQTQNSETFVTANKIQMQCMNCHNNSDPSSGYKWSEIFKNDWSSIYARCNDIDRNPYRCKSMHGLFSAYSFFFTAWKMEVKNYELAYESAKEMNRIVKDLNEKQFLHGSENILAEIQSQSEGIMQKAKQKDPEAFTDGLLITQSCMKCHADGRINRPLTQSLIYLRTNLKIKGK
jgi:hypothetical protein